MCPQVTFSVWISELFFSRAKHTSFHFHWQLQTEANFWNTGMHLKFHFHFSEIIQMSSVNTEPSQQSELFSILLWRGSWFWLFTHFGAIKSPRLRLGLFIAPKCVKSQNQLPFYTIKFYRPESWQLGLFIPLICFRLTSWRRKTKRKGCFDELENSTLETWEASKTSTGFTDQQGDWREGEDEPYKVQPSSRAAQP